MIHIFKKFMFCKTNLNRKGNKYYVDIDTIFFLNEQAFGRGSPAQPIATLPLQLGFPASPTPSSPSSISIQ